LVDIVTKQAGEVRFMVNDVLLNLKNFDPLFVPINAYGAQGKETAKKLEETWAGPHNILYYPSGLVSRKVKGKIVDLEWKKTVITKSIKHQREIVPVYINARNSNFFYRLANFRKFLRIKANIEMFYLPNEMYKQKNKEYQVIIGNPIHWSKFEPPFSHLYWASWLRGKVYELSLQVNNI